MKKTTTTNLFQTAKTVEPKKKQVSQKETIKVSIPLQRWDELKTIIANSEAELKMIEGELKQTAKSEFIRQYESMLHRPDSFLLEGTDGGKCMVIPQDRYLAVTDEKKEMLDSIADDITEDATEYIFNPELLQKYQKQISDSLMKANIPDEDKQLLILAKKKTTVRKGIIDRLHQYKDKMKEVFYGIDVVFQLKNAR